MQFNSLQKASNGASKVVENNAVAKNGLSLPAVPVLQKKPLQKKELEEEEPIQPKLAAQLTGGSTDAGINSSNYVAIEDAAQFKKNDRTQSGHFVLQHKALDVRDSLMNKFSLAEAAEKPFSRNVAQPVQRFVLPTLPSQQKKAIAAYEANGTATDRNLNMPVQRAFFNAQHTMAPNKVVQRVVSQNTAGKWVSSISFFKGKKYDTRTKAEAEESRYYTTEPGAKKGTRRKMPLKKLRTIRRQTFYGVIGESDKQGPHVVAHTYNATNSINPDSSVEDLALMFNDQILPLGEFNKIVDEIITKHNVTDVVKLKRFNYAKELYAGHYTAALSIIKKSEDEVAANDSLVLYDRIRRMMDLDPSATYKWMTQDATEEEMSGKGEGRSIDFNTYIDNNWGLDKFIGTKHMKDFIKRRAKLSKTKFRYYRYLSKNLKSDERAKEFLKIKNSDEYQKERLARNFKMQKEKRADVLKRLRAIK